MIETFQKAVAEYGMVTTLLLGMVAGMGYIIWKRLLQQPKTNGKRSTYTDKTSSIMQAIQSHADASAEGMSHLKDTINIGNKELRTIIDENAKEGRHLIDETAKESRHISESLRDDLDDTRRELKGDIKSVSDDVKSEVQTRRMDVISLHQKIDSDKNRK